MRSIRLTPAVLLLLLPPASLPAQTSGDLRPTVFAVRGAKIVVEPGRVIEKGTVVVRDGLVESVREGAGDVPPDALVIDGAGKVVYPGFIDAAASRGYDAGLRRSLTGPPQPVNLATTPLIATKPDHRKGLTPEFEVRTALNADEEKLTPWRKLGFTAQLVAPDGGIFAGQSALVSLSGMPPRRAVLRSPVALHAAFRRVSGSDYPRSLMGIIAHARQTLLDAGHYRRARDAFEQRGRVGVRPPDDPCLEALLPVLGGELPVVFEADSADEIHQALDFAEEFRLRPIILGGRDARKVVNRLKATATPVLLCLDFPEAGEREKKLPKRARDDWEDRRKEEIATAALLYGEGVRFAFTTWGLGGDKPWEKFPANLREAIKAGLPEDAALAALTREPAEIFGVAQQLGTVEPGKAAHLFVTDRPFHDPKAQVLFTFSDGVRFEFDAKEEKEKKEERKPERKKDDPSSPLSPRGRGAGGEGALSPLSPRGRGAGGEGGEKPEPATEIESDRKPRLQTGGDVLIRAATVLTVSEKGTLPETDILVRQGKIAEIGKDLPLPPGVTVIDAAGMFVMPGIIDTHSHFGIRGGVNEFSLSVVPEVRVRDVIDSEDVAIYRALGGGVTTARLLHGSANVIGGQDAVIKLKYGTSAREMLVADAPRGVKFALGENVKRTDGRFPNSRLGVEAVLVRAFSEAQVYKQQWERYRQSLSTPNPLPEPRRDLRLEALADVLSGELRVHCHCYRADEILMLLQVADRFGFKVRSLQHVLEGYKIAPEIAAHGASCSLFSDWWAYKIEAYDAIPYAAALLREAGASVCLKSDSDELVRHLYQEAAKCVKYGGMSEADALKTITLNAAGQLGLEKRIGSIEVGKDADLAVFNGHPLNSFARCEMTLVEGEVFFQRGEELKPSVIAKAGPTPSAKPFGPIPRSPDGKYLIRGATLHRPGRPPLESASVLVVGGKIAAVNGGSAEGAREIDATGLHLYPGLIDAGTVLGLTELGSAQETQDFRDGGDFQPDLRASIAINPDSELIPVTRSNGVLSVVTRPTGSMIAGQAALINLAGWVPAEMVVADPLALQVELPSEPRFLRGNPDAPFAGRAIARREREQKVRRLKELFAQAKVYDAARQKRPDVPIDPRLAALVPYAKGEKPVIIEAAREGELREALELAEELKLKVILSGAIEAWKLADELKERDIPVIVGPVMALPRERHDPYDAAYACPAKLHAAGVRFCIRSDGGSNTRNLPYHAAMAVAYGLPPEEALKAVTLYPAQILGVADQLGSVEPGKRANLVLTNGDLLQASTQVLALFIDGRPLAPESKQTRLYERYRQRLIEVKNGHNAPGSR